MHDSIGSNSGSNNNCNMVCEHCCSAAVVPHEAAQKTKIDGIAP